MTREPSNDEMRFKLEDTINITFGELIIPLKKYILHSMGLFIMNNHLYLVAAPHLATTPSNLQKQPTCTIYQHNLIANLLARSRYTT